MKQRLYPGDSRPCCPRCHSLDLDDQDESEFFYCNFCGWGFDQWVACLMLPSARVQCSNKEEIQ